MDTTHALASLITFAFFAAPIAVAITIIAFRAQDARRAYGIAEHDGHHADAAHAAKLSSDHRFVAGALFLVLVTLVPPREAFSTIADPLWIAHAVLLLSVGGGVLGCGLSAIRWAQDSGRHEARAEQLALRPVVRADEVRA